MFLMRYFECLIFQYSAITYDVLANATSGALPKQNAGEKRLRDIPEGAHREGVHTVRA